MLLLILRGEKLHLFIHTYLIFYGLIVSSDISQVFIRHDIPNGTYIFVQLPDLNRNVFHCTMHLAKYFSVDGFTDHLYDAEIDMCALIASRPSILFIETN